MLFARKNFAQYADGVLLLEVGIVGGLGLKLLIIKRLNCIHRASWLRSIDAGSLGTSLMLLAKFLRNNIRMESSFRKATETALKLMLTPVVRFWMQRSGSLQRFVDLLKIVFVEVALEDMKRKQENITISRISAMTGVHRTDVSKITKGQPEDARNLPHVVTRVVGQWEHNKRYLDEDGKPRELTVKGSRSEFKALVETVSKSIGAPSVLFDLERTGSIVRTENGVKLVRATIKHTGIEERSLNLVSRNVSTMFAAISENIEGQNEVPHYMLRTEYDNVLVRDLPKIRKWLQREGRKFHKRARDFLSKFDQDIHPEYEAEAGARVVLGGFSWVEEPVRVPELEEV